MGKWELSTVGKINTYKGKSINPLNTPDQIYELYSVPSWDSNYPEIIKGSDIGSTKQIVEKGDVLLCKINPRINRVWIVEQHTHHPLIASSEWIIVRNQDINSRYLLRYFQASLFRDMMISEQSGIGGSLTRAQPKRVSSYSVPIPSLPVQQQIADVLDRATALIQKRKAQIDKLDLLVKSQFIQMFGTIHSTKYPIKELAEITEFIKDGTHQTPAYTNDSVNGFKFLSSKDVITKKINWSNIKYIPESLHNKLYTRIAPRRGDLLLAKNGTTGIAAIVDTDEVFDIYVSLALIRFLPGSDIVYLWAAINSKDTKRQFDDSLKGIGVPNLHLGEIKKARIIIPPVSLQTQFANFVHQVEAQKALLQQSLAKLEQNYKSLMQKCFRGEIF